MFTRNLFPRSFLQNIEKCQKLIINQKLYSHHNLSTMSSIRPISEVLSKATAANAKFNIFASLRSSSQLEKSISSISNESSLGNTTVAIKDNISTIEEPTSCSSKILSDYQSPFEATVVSLLKKEGAITVGKTNMDEFGMGSGTIHSTIGPTLNPLFPDSKHISGGSSGGSAAAVAADVVDFALGTDTGGSVRLPAAYTGVYGFKPTYGRLSRWGVIAYAQSLDTVGVLSKDLNLLKKVYNTLDKHDGNDPTSLSDKLRHKIKDSKISNSKLRIGVVKELVLDNLSEEVTKGWSQVVNKLQEHYEIIPVSIPTLKYALPVYYTIAPAEAASNLARYDGIRYGFRSDSDKNHYAKTRSTGFGQEVQNRILLGNYNLNSDSYKNHFLKAQNLRNAIKKQFDSVFKLQNVLSANTAPETGVDVILSPVSMTTAPSLEKFQSQKPTESYVNDAFTVPASLAGLPAISVPWISKKGDLPIGIQIMAQYGDDDQVLSLAQVLSEINETTK